ncbi:MAG: hypothetical protein U0324_10330 [Polyangiales bacterium]
MNDPPPDLGARRARTIHELDGAVASFELTVISIVQGMALSFLVEGARSVFVEGRLAPVPYLLAGIFIACGLWTRAVLHAFTVIRWPLDLEHNFLYFLAAMLEAALFSQAGRPERWYPVGAAMVLLFWGMFVRERRMYRARRRDVAGPAGAALLDALEREHELNIRAFMPATVAAWVAATALVFAAPGVFLVGGWHVALGALQALGFAGYLAHVARFYHRVIDRVVEARAEGSVHAG